MEFTSPYQSAQPKGLAGSLAGVMTGVYSYMCLGLLLTAFAALYAASSDGMLMALFNIIMEQGQIIITGPSMLFYVLLGAELALVLGFSMLLNRIPFGACLAIFSVYSIINGITLSVIFLVYASASIFSAFLTTALTFGAMSAYGYFTKKDLTSVGKLCMMGLIGIIIASIVNIFIIKGENAMMNLLISIIGLFVFIGLTAYDTQKIKANLESTSDETAIKKITIAGALALYLDFINIFLYILRLMGKKR